MIKSLSSLFLVFLLCGPVSAIAQDRKDSDTTNTTTGSDSTSSMIAQSEEDASNDSLNQPIADSLFSTTGPIREVSQAQVNRYKRSPDYAYANDPQYWRKEPRQTPGLLYWLIFNRTLRWILLAVIAILVLFGVYTLAKEINFSLLIRKPDPGVAGTELSLTKEKINFDEAIGRSQAEGNYRMAIRFLYLRLIHFLRDKGKITFRDSSTNAEITRAMGKHLQATSFRWLATVYEYTYYGGFQPNLELYEKLKMDFENFQKILSD